MRILLADDQGEVRSGIKVLLAQEEGLNVIGEAEGLGSLIIQAKEGNPDVVLLDWELANLRMGEVIPVLRTLCPGMKVIALSGRPEAEKAAMHAGVDAFVSKGGQPEALLEKIKGFNKEE